MRNLWIEYGATSFSFYNHNWSWIMYNRGGTNNVTIHEHIWESVSSTFTPMNSISSQNIRYQIKSCAKLFHKFWQIDDLVYTLILPNTSLVYLACTWSKIMLSFVLYCQHSFIYLQWVDPRSSYPLNPMQVGC